MNRALISSARNGYAANLRDAVFARGLPRVRWREGGAFTERIHDERVLALAAS